MAKIYFRHIVAGEMTFAEVRPRWRVSVQELLIAAGRADLCVLPEE